MHCQKCGKELQEGERFCPACGTKADSPGTVTLSLNAEKLHSRLTGRLNKLGKQKITYLMGILLSIVNLFLMNREMFEVAYMFTDKGWQTDEVWQYGSVVQFSMFDGMDWMQYVRYGFCAAYLVGILLMVMPLTVKENRSWQKKNFRLGMMTPLANVIWLVISYVIAAYTPESVVYNLEGIGCRLIEYTQVNLTGTVWLFMAVSVIASWAINDTKNELVH